MNRIWVKVSAIGSGPGWIFNDWKILLPVFFEFSMKKWCAFEIQYLSSSQGIRFEQKHRFSLKPGFEHSVELISPNLKRTYYIRMYSFVHANTHRTENFQK